MEDAAFALAFDPEDFEALFGFLAGLVARPVGFLRALAGLFRGLPALALLRCFDCFLRADIDDDRRGQTPGFAKKTI